MLIDQSKHIYFRVPASKYVAGKEFDIVRPASLNHPKDNAVMFIGPQYMEKIGAFDEVQNCLVFWPKDISVPENLETNHAVVKCVEPRNAYCLFFRENQITYLPSNVDVEEVNGAFISKDAVIGGSCTIFPGAYIGPEVTIGNNVYIGSGARLVGEIRIGNNVVIRENAVLGADGLSTDRDVEGHAATMPQFGGLILEDNVQIGANTTIARAAIDYTIISKGSKIDNSTFISHNVFVGPDTFVVGETIMFGSSSTGSKVFISGNSTIRDGRHIGDGATVGMGSVVVKNVQEQTVVKGNPAR